MLATRGQYAYERLRKIVQEEAGHDAFNPRPMPEFEELHPHMRLCWERMAEEIALSVTVSEATLNEKSETSREWIDRGLMTRRANQNDSDDDEGEVD